MKPFNKLRRSDEKAISTIISVILMVAIAVASAAVVFVYVGGMLGDTNQQSPEIACIADSSADKITITYAAPIIKWSDIGITTDNETVNWRVYDSTANPLDSAKCTNGSIAQISSGDYIQFDFLAHPGMTGNVIVSLRFIPTNTLLGSWIVTV